VDINRGTPALLAAACRTLEYFQLPPPQAFLIGDTGRGAGSRRLYEHMVARLADDQPETLVFHYLQPDVDWHNQVLFAIEALQPRPRLIADAGFMYAAKMSGLAASYDLFTPDLGELAFLADETAPHPFYTRGFILHEEQRLEELIRRAWRHDNAAQRLLVKGREDRVVIGDSVVARVKEPLVEAMEAIGGTGDSLTGVVSALIHSGMEIAKASELAARTNRLAGWMAGLNPASQIGELIQWLPEALSRLPAKNG
jgi:NAD(P)H-hydrate repair Nnr-like enzyme with NAD(P)H-hydrate dehydratase domain